MRLRTIAPSCRSERGGGGRISNRPLAAGPASAIFRHADPLAPSPCQVELGRCVLKDSTARSPSAARRPPRAWAPTWPAGARAGPRPVLARRARAPDARPRAARTSPAAPRSSTRTASIWPPPRCCWRACARSRPSVRHVMIVGHDPGMHGLALELAGAGEPEALQALAAKFPTGGAGRDPLQGARLVQGRPRQGPPRAVHDAQDAADA